MRWLILFIGLVGASAQQVFPPAFWASGSSPAFVPTSISGMAYYWNYTDMPLSGNVSNWVDRIQSVAANQGNPNLRPTNSSSGVWFSTEVPHGTGSWLTNVEFNVASNYSIWISFKPHIVDASYRSLIDAAAANSGFFIAQSKTDYYFAGDHNIADPVADVSYELVWANGATWTNGVAAASTSIRTTAQPFGNIGDDSNSQKFIGFIKFIGIWTNKALTLTDAQNLYTYGSTH